MEVLIEFLLFVVKPCYLAWKIGGWCINRMMPESLQEEPSVMEQDFQKIESLTWDEDAFVQFQMMMEDEAYYEEQHQWLISRGVIDENGDLIRDIA